MADVAVELQDRGHRGPILVVSRHGLLPNVHAPTAFWPSFIDSDRPPQTSLALLRLVRREAAEARTKGVDWRAVVDSLRPHLILLWRALPLGEQMRALRHLRAYWDAHRHRIAPEIDARLSALRAEGRLEVIAGALVDGRSTPEAIEIDVRLRGAGRIETLRADRVVNCTGPNPAFARTGDPLVRALLSKGFAKPDRVGLGTRSHIRLRRGRCVGPSPREPVRDRTSHARRVLGDAGRPRVATAGAGDGAAGARSARGRRLSAAAGR